MTSSLWQAVDAAQLQLHLAAAAADRFDPAVLSAAVDGFEANFRKVCHAASCVHNIIPLPGPNYRTRLRPRQPRSRMVLMKALKTLFDSLGSGCGAT